VKGFKIVILTAILLTYGNLLKGQLSNVENLTPKQLNKFGRNAERAGDYLTAIYFYERYREFKPNNNELNFELANLHRQVRNYEKAKELYLKVVEESSDKYPLSRLYYAQMLKSTGQYDEAIVQFDKFKKGSKTTKDFSQYSKIIKNEVDGCDSAKKIIEHSLNLTVGSLNSTINGAHIELSPIPISDTVFMYASLRADSLVFFTGENADTAIPVRQFYYARKSNLDWIGGQNVPKPINIPGVETGNGTLSRDGSRFYFTRCFKNWQGKSICGIYLSQKSGQGWTEPVKLPPLINDPNFTSTQPALGRTAQSNSEILYFVSDRPEGRGGLDIWYTIWNEKKQLYSKPENLGSKINTSGDEMTPFYDMRIRTLYFSSTGLTGIGGLDIFSALGERREWSNIENVGYPLNTSYDDLYFTISKSGEYGFLVSNRPGINSASNETCCDDIYYYRWNDFIRIGVTGVIYPFEKDKYGRKRDLSNFDFMNPPDSIIPLNKAIIALYMLDKENKQYIFMDRDTTGKNGIFYFDLLPNQEYEFKMEGFQYFDSKNYLSTDFFDFSDIIEMPPTWVNVLSDKPVVLENIYYDFKSAELNQRAKNVLDTTLLVMLKEAPEFVAEIGAHTDSIGDTKYNIELSQARANNVVNYLISKGISSKRLVPKGYGAQRPVAPNYNPDGSDNPEGRDKNRRTEFRIIGTIGGEFEEEEFNNN
jgi:outer membrane protein OmpA-like peptidoglycan-associated protein/tetratricopeptide (TPR) repeat protein